MKKLLKIKILITILMGVCCLSAYSAEKIILEAVIGDVSVCPEPEKIDYPNCNLTLTAELNSVIPKKVILVIPCIRDKKKILPSFIQKGAKIRFQYIPDKELSESEKSIQMSDQNTDFELDYLYACNIVYIDSLTIKSNTQGLSFIQSPISSAPDADRSIVLTNEEKQEYTRYINTEKERLSNILKLYHPETYSVFIKQFADIGRKIGNGEKPFVTVSTKTGKTKVFPIDALWLTKPARIQRDLQMHRDLMLYNAEIIAEVNHFFEKKGILFIVVPIPEHYESIIQKFLPSQPPLSTYNINRILFENALLERGVCIFDFEPYIERNLDEDFYFYRYLEQNIHLTKIGYSELAKQLTAFIKRYKSINSLIQNNFKLTKERILIPSSYAGKEFCSTYDLKFIRDNNCLTEKSPFLLIGDSFTMDHLRKTLADELGMKICAISNSSVGPRIARLLQIKEKKIPSEAKICFFVFYSSYLSEKFDGFIFPQSKISLNDEDIIGGKAVFQRADEYKKDSIEFDIELDLRKYIKINSNQFHLTFHIKAGRLQQYSIQIAKTIRYGFADDGTDIIDIPIPKDIMKENIKVHFTVKKRSNKDRLDPLSFSLNDIMLSFDKIK